MIIHPPKNPFSVVFDELPSDKSVAQRALIFSIFCNKPVRIEGFQGGEDALFVLNALKALGKKIQQNGDVLTLSGDIKSPLMPLDMGNSGTGTRLMMGALSGKEGSFSLKGDESLSKRPMRRVSRPLSSLGAKIRTTQGKLPLSIEGGALRQENMFLPLSLPSAQVHAATVLARLGIPTRLQASNQMRDHTERMLWALGMKLSRFEGLQKRTLCWESGAMPQGGVIHLPKDPSSAAFWITAALLSPKSSVALLSVGLNPTRLGFWRILERMGADIRIRPNSQQKGYEPIGTLWASGRKTLQAVHIKGNEATDAIDELVAFSLLAAIAEGESVVEGAGELRTKESDRIKGIVKTLLSLGVQIKERKDGFSIMGMGKGAKFQTPKEPLSSSHDHRIAMIQAIAVLRMDDPICLTQPECVAVSYPRFFWDLKKLGIRLESA